MKLGEAIGKSEPTGYIFRVSNINKKYYKDHEKTIIERILEDHGRKGLYFKDYEYFNPEQRYNVYEKVRK